MSSEKKPISIYEYRMRPIIDAKVSKLLDSMDDEEADKLLNSGEFSEILKKIYIDQKKSDI